MHPFPRSLARRGLISLSGSVALAIGAGAIGAEPSYTYHYGVTGAYAGAIDLGDTPIRRDVIVFYQNNFGRYPSIDRETGAIINGGLPQLADYQDHFTACVGDILRRIPDEAWDGYAVIDFESWTPWWTDTPGLYRDASIADIRARRPELTDEEAEALARTTYEQAARLIFEGTLQLAHSLRPNARWGYWAYPQGRHAEIENTGWLWDASDAFYPDVYMKDYLVPETEEPGLGEAPYSKYISGAFDGNLAYARQVAGDSKPVLAFAWPRYRQSNANQWHRRHFLEPQHLVLMLSGPYFWDADGVVLWDSLIQQGMADLFQDYFDSAIGPEMERMTGYVIEQDRLDEQNQLREDINRDGQVDTSDLTYVLKHMGTDDALADINLDGIVDAVDLTLVTRAFTG